MFIKLNFYTIFECKHIDQCSLIENLTEISLHLSIHTLRLYEYAQCLSLNS